MATSIKQQIPTMTDHREQEALRKLFEAVLNDLQAGGGGTAVFNDLTQIKVELAQIAADLAAIRTAVTGLTAKLDDDAGVTDVDYAATLDPAALTTSVQALTLLSGYSAGLLTA